MVDPLSIRVERPYASEEEFLDAEAWAVTARSMLLIDVGPLPEGTPVRCELQLRNGHALVVAEGFAVKHLGATPTRPAGLVVRYRRMSAASSEFVKRAVARNAQARPGSSPTAATGPALDQSTSQEQGATARSSAGAPQRRTSGHPPRSSRSPVADQPSARPPSTAIRSSKPPKQPSVSPGPGATTRSVSVIPPARRVSSLPPERSSRSLSQSSAHQKHETPGNSSVPHNSQAAKEPIRLHRSTAPQPAGTADGAPLARIGHDSGAMQRLRSRATSKAISTPPDREAVLSRLKKKPTR
jgi:hypothetical protein